MAASTDMAVEHLLADPGPPEDEERCWAEADRRQYRYTQRYGTTVGDLRDASEMGGRYLQEDPGGYVLD